MARPSLAPDQYEWKSPKDPLTTSDPVGPASHPEWSDRKPPNSHAPHSGDKHHRVSRFDQLGSSSTERQHSYSAHPNSPPHIPTGPSLYRTRPAEHPAYGVYSEQPQRSRWNRPAFNAGGSDRFVSRSESPVQHSRYPQSTEYQGRFDQQEKSDGRSFSPGGSRNGLTNAPTGPKAMSSKYMQSSPNNMFRADRRPSLSRKPKDVDDWPTGRSPVKSDYQRPISPVQKPARGDVVDHHNGQKIESDEAARQTLTNFDEEHHGAEPGQTSNLKGRDTALVDTPQALAKGSSHLEVVRSEAADPPLVHDSASVKDHEASQGSLIGFSQTSSVPDVNQVQKDETEGKEAVGNKPADIGPDDIVSRIYSHNAKTKSESLVTLGQYRLPDTKSDLTRYHFFEENKEKHEQLLPDLIEVLSERSIVVEQKIEKLSRQYRSLRKRWLGYVENLEAGEKEESDIAAQHNDETALNMNNLVGRSSRRGLTGNFAYGDAARSEAEFLEILASLERETANEPSQNLKNTTADVPAMVLDPEERRLIFNDQNRLVRDPLIHYQYDGKRDIWTDEEQQIFQERFGECAKNFGKIASYLPNKTTTQCVLHYYLTKKVVKYRSKAQERGFHKRKKASLLRRQPLERKKSKGSSLMTDITAAQADDEDNADPEDIDNDAGNEDDNDENGASLGRTNDTIGSQAPAKSTLLDTVSAEVTETKEAMAKSRPNPNDGESLERSPKRFKTNGVTAEGHAKSKSELPSRVSDPVGDPPSNTEQSKPRGRPPKKMPTSSYWSVAEIELLPQLIKNLGTDFHAISQEMRSKSNIQVRNFYWKNRERLKLDGDPKPPNSGDTSTAQEKPPTDVERKPPPMFIFEESSVRNASSEARRSVLFEPSERPTDHTRPNDIDVNRSDSTAHDPSQWSNQLQKSGPTKGTFEAGPSALHTLSALAAQAMPYQATSDASTIPNDGITKPSTNGARTASFPRVSMSTPSTSTEVADETGRTPDLMPGPSGEERSNAPSNGAEASNETG